MAVVARRRSFFGKFLRAVLWTGLALVGVLAGLIALYAFVPPVSTLMLARLATGRSYERTYAPLARMSPAAVAAVVASEDATFCDNDGIDWDALTKVLGREHGPDRGASTITMQTAKNLFLWPGRSYIRKGFEIPIAVTLGKVWPKRRTLEIYLNIAEWGDGIFGMEAAAQRYFHKSASALNAEEGALLAVALPNPVKRDPSRPKAFHRRLAGAIVTRARMSPESVACLD
jgi:monofunctional glycosyltransferase